MLSSGVALPEPEAGGVPDGPADRDDTALLARHD